MTSTAAASWYFLIVELIAKISNSTSLGRSEYGSLTQNQLLDLWDEICVETQLHRTDLQK